MVPLVLEDVVHYTHMEHKLSTYKTVLYVAAAAGIVLTAIAALWYAGSYARSFSPEHGWNTLNVSAEGKATGIPNIAQIEFSVTTEGGKDVAALQTETNKKMDDITKFLEEQGVKKEDIKTTAYNITPRYQYFPCTGMSCRQPETSGYTVSQSVSVKVREVAKAGEILSGAVSRGANGTSGPTFVVDDRTELENEARAEAIGKAKAKAEAIAKASGLKLGKLLYVSDDGSGMMPMYEGKMGMGMGGDMMQSAPAANIQPGSQDVTVNVSLTYSLR